MEYQVLPILREYYIDGIIRLSNDASDNYLNKYLAGKVELSDAVINAIIEYFENLKNGESGEKQ